MVVIYRKYRPKTFSEIVGQEHIVKILQNQLLSNQVSHAYLFYGPRGTGKTTLGRLLAKTVNCQNPKEIIKKGSTMIEPCNQCSSCQQIDQQRSIDLIEIDAASNRGIEEIRNLRESAKIVPTMSKYKVYILDEAHQLTNEASNALLKILEEPPSHVIFILCTTEFSKMLPTIASRCQKFNFKKLNINQIEQKLKKDAESEKIKIEDEALNIIARASGGSIRDAESLLDKVITLQDKIITKEEVEEILGFVETKIISELIDAILLKDQKKCFAILESNLEQNIDTGQFTKSIIEYLRN
ncbi:MAG: DNA polymerase III subunit gamma/tau, partial [Candidatus Pacebacteria bacterium]|nr:DNA polymerase III subunit gamma/tau [Candidatus Paceibacterota bacterium]